MHRSALCQDLLDLKLVVLTAIAQGRSSTNVRSQNPPVSSGTPESAKAIVCRSVGSCFLSRKAYNAGSGKQTGTPKRSRLLQETASAGRQTVRGSLLALVSSIRDRRNYTVKPQYANAWVEVRLTSCLDDRKSLWLAIRAVPGREGFCCQGFQVGRIAERLAGRLPRPMNEAAR